MIYTIYEIKPLNKDIEYSYIGSTNNFKRRQQEHKFNCNNINSKDYKYNLYEFIRENGGFDKFEFIILEEIDCESNLNARIREQYWIEHRENKLNIFRAYISKEEKIEQKKQCDKEYRDSNKDKIKEHKRQYYEQNKKEINEKRKIIINCECCSFYSFNNKSRHFKSIKHQNYLLQLERNI